VTFVPICIIIFLCCITFSLFIDVREMNRLCDVRDIRMRELEKTLLQVDNDLGVQRSDNEDLVSENRRLRRELTRNQRANTEKNAFMKERGIKDAYDKRIMPPAPTFTKAEPESGL